MITRKYNLINNIGGWVVFVIALVTYWLTLEPTASYWDCGEFIIQADKLEVGHPPGNPIFMLTARFFSNFATSQTTVSVMVNAMSGLLSALTILLLFWTISHLVRRLTVADDRKQELTLTQYLVIMGSAGVGSLAYCWSDTFWFSAVEGEVYAFSSFCTALVFWLILKWENRADDRSSDRYLILIAYIIGVSIAVHLLNLLCIPAIVLVFVYRKYKDMNLVKSLIALLVSFVILVAVLYGLVPGFVKVAQVFELYFVNTLGLSFNSGAIAYGIVTLAVFAWTLYAVSRGGNDIIAKASFIVSMLLSGIFFFSAAWLGWVLLLALGIFLFSKWGYLLSRRVMNVMMWSVAVIFVGYSSYALILIRSSADTPMNQNSPDNVFDLASYLSREQYGETPLLYGETLYSSPMKRFAGMRQDTLFLDDQGNPVTMPVPVYNGQVVDKGQPLYAKGVRGAAPKSEYNFLNDKEINANAELAQRDGDYYVKRDYKPEARMYPELNMIFPRLYSRQHAREYGEWVAIDTMPGQLVHVSALTDDGDRVNELDLGVQPSFNEVTGAIFYPEKLVYKPTFGQNLTYFINYQLNHMYMRYFMWNFAGRQNDLLNQHGELDAGNWISGIPFIDNARLGDQSLLPDDLGKNNAGHNRYFFLPLILGIIGLVWQSFAGKRGIEQFWVVFFLFFMTGIAIVLYLNQTPLQPRERDYAFAGSFYAYAIWIGMGVAGLYKLLQFAFRKRNEKYLAAAACAVGICVPLQMVSQTWDDHDRSGRYAARDFAINYLNSLEPDAIVFCNGDNDTFPLWYAQEVEGVRPDVKIINLSYLASDWYANQMRMPSYSAKPVHFTAKPEQIAYGLNDVTMLGTETAPTDLLSSLKLVYSDKLRDPDYGYRTLPGSIVSIPVDRKAVIARGLVAPKDSANIENEIMIDLSSTTGFRQKGYLGLNEILMLDIIATNAAEGWPRPIYWCSTVGDEYHLGLTDYVRSTGMTHQLVPTRQPDKAPRLDRALKNVTSYRWGGADSKGRVPYFDETARRMLYSTRNSMVEVAGELVYEADLAKEAGDTKKAATDYRSAIRVIDLMLEKTPASVAPLDLSLALSSGQVLIESGRAVGDKKAEARGMKILEDALVRNAQYVRYNTMISGRFGVGASTSYDSRYMPYQYYRIIEVMRQYGADEKKIKAGVALTGLSEEQLKQFYDRLSGTGAADGGGEPGLGEIADELNKYAEIVNTLSTMSPEDYAQTTADERLIDSMMIRAIDYYIEMGGKEEDLQQLPNFAKFDRARSERIWKEYKERNGI